jgi:hypothetical protein
MLSKKSKIEQHRSSRDSPMKGPVRRVHPDSGPLADGRLFRVGPILLQKRFWASE